MAVRTEKTESGQDIVIDGWETGIAPSPHKGIANIQNGNISTETGEVTASFMRVQQSMTSTSTGTGSLAFADSSHVSLSIAGSNGYFKGQWITVTNSNHTGELPNGTYYVPPSTGSNFQLANYYNTANYYAPVTVTTLTVGGGGGGGGSNNSSGAGGGGGGQVSSTSASLLLSGAYNVVIGAGGAGGVDGATDGSSGGSSILYGNGISVTAVGGSGGQHDSILSPLGGASGSGQAGGGASGGGGGGGGGDSAAGTNASGGTGGNGGAGTSNSASGASVSYGGGAGGGGATPGTGTGGGGNGGGAAANGVAGTANRGGGGGGANSALGATRTGGAGGSGVVIISIPTSAGVTATGGVHTVSGGNDIWTFTTNGTWTPTLTQTTVTSPITGFTSGLTATIQLVRNMGLPLAQATETYYRSGTKYNRYYILDNQNLVWVYDTYNEVLYSASDNVNWFLPDYQTSWCTGATGLTVISGFLLATAKSGIYGKQTDLLGNTNTTTTTWAQFNNISGWQSGALNSPHYAFTGHQGKAFITDGNYVAEIFPESSLANTSASSQNVQSFSSWTLYGGGNVPYDGLYSVIDGTSPIAADGGRVPAVFFTNSAGHLPASMTVGTVYYISANTTYFDVFLDPAVPTSSSFTFTGALSSGATLGTLSTAWPYKTGSYSVTFSNGDVRPVTFTKNSTSATWTVPLTSPATASASYVGYMDLSTGAFGTQYFNTFYPIATASGYAGTTPTFLYTPQRLSLPAFEIAQTIGEIGNLALVGCNGNVVYPWNQVSNLPGTIIPLPEGNVVNIVTVNSMAYLFAGNNGNVYITDGSIASLVLNIPDYCAGVPGSPGTYIESTYYWGGAMYLRGRVYFSMIDQSTTKVGNCGGIWSIVPTQNLYIGQDTGIALRLESQNSYGNYNGTAALLIGKQVQDMEAPLYWSAWYSSVSSPAYGIDYSTNGTSASSPTVIETDAIPVGTMLTKKTLSQLEYKLGAPLDAGATITAQYRANITDTWANCNSFKVEDNALSGYAPVNFQKVQWLQFRFTLTPVTSAATSNSFIRFREIRLR